MGFARNGWSAKGLSGNMPTEQRSQRRTFPDSIHAGCPRYARRPEAGHQATIGSIPTRCTLFHYSFDNEQNSGRSNRVSVPSAVAVTVSAIAERLYGTERHPKTAFAL